MTCIICGGSNQKKLLEKKDFSLWRCENCGVVKTCLPAGMAVGKFDDTQYQSKKEIETQFRTQRIQFQDYAQRIFRLLPIQKGRLLDVGCGLGFLVKLANENGFLAYGIDSGKACIIVGREKLKVNTQFSNLSTFHPKNKFDMIVANHVIEHSNNPREFLRQVKRVLKPGGQVLISCPNFDSLMLWVFQERWYGLVPKQHRFQFSPKSLRFLLEKEGFKVEKVVVNDLDYQVSGWKGIIFSVLLEIAKLLNFGDQVIVLAKIK